MITRYGYDVYFTVLGICIVVVVLAVIFLENGLFRYFAISLSAAALLFSTNFFRDPERTTPPIEKGVLSPADGKVIIVKEVEQLEYLGGRAMMVSVFMSPLNVHVNRNPITGTVEYLRYVPGEYFAAFEDKASEQNEQSIIGVKNKHGKVLFKQIAGFVARRIIYELKVGDSVTVGKRFGMIKFGSRVDVFVPVESRVKVKVGDRAVAGESVLAEFL
jgi:phosphatidylserine decarboxylase